jgi:hypothetical protein
MANVADGNVRQVRLSLARTDAWIDDFIGAFPDERHCDLGVFAGEAVDVYKHDGKLLLALRPKTIKRAAIGVAWEALLRAAGPTTKRTIAAGGQVNFRSGTIGYYKRRLTYATRLDLDGYRRIQPLLVNMARVFAEQRPAEYADLKEMADLSPRYIIPGTGVLSSAAVNRSSPYYHTRMAVHRDDGNLPGAYGVMTVACSGDYTGGWLVFPKYRVAVDLRNGDCLIADNQEAHGNTAMVDEEGWERVSVVGYYHASNRPPA